MTAVPPAPAPAVALAGELFIDLLAMQIDRPFLAGQRSEATQG